MNDPCDRGMCEEDWFNLGKADAWAGKIKSPPESALAASMYDLGYSEGEIKNPPIVDRITVDRTKKN